jgi:hypothetical protein
MGRRAAILEVLLGRCGPGPRTGLSRAPCLSVAAVYLFGAVLMVVAAFVEWRWGVAAARRRSKMYPDPSSSSMDRPRGHRSYEAKALWNLSRVSIVQVR